ncbi:membrane protein [Aquipluma nitroreducens]|uniref:Membrane protein n=2 Tax=Aquipluma nitroreducens TaxID=2010828 RepID=A0A5K7SC52_9BACT|nr:membrane protein [Aquipluma nitroreducens]
MTFFICVFILLMQFLWKYIDDLVGKGLDWGIVSELLMYASFGLVPLAFPLAMLLASIMTFGNLGENYELVAMKASGISLFRIMRPLFVVALILTSIAFYFSNNILPKTNLKFYTLMYSVKQQKPEMVIKEGVFSNDMENYSIKVERKGKNNNMLYDVMIYNHADNQGNVNVSISDSGKMEITQDKKFMSITLYNGQNYTEGTESRQSTAKRYPFRRESFQKEVINISMKDFEFNRIDEKRYAGASKMMNVSQLTSQGDSVFKEYKLQLWRYLTAFSYISDVNRQVSWLSNPIDSLRINPNIKPDSIVDFDKTIAALSTFEKAALYQRVIGNVRSNSLALTQQFDEMYMRKKSLNSYAMEWHRKFTLSFACLIFFFIGAPLGAIIRKGGLGMPVVVSILMFIAYYILMITGEKFAREDAWSMVGGMWLASFVFLPLGIWLTYKAATDSGVMNIESYQALFKRLTKVRFFNRHKPE